MAFDEVELRRISLELKSPMETSLGVETDRDLVILGVKRGDQWLYGEASPMSHYQYNHETADTAMAIAREYVVPTLREVDTVDAYHERLSSIRGHRMAISLGDQVLHYADSIDEGRSVAELLGGTNETATCGVSLGLADDDAIVGSIERFLDQGYRRIKVKIKPGRDIDYIRHIREHFPSIDLMADANAAYTLDDIDHLARLDAFDLTMIEQPLAAGDLVDHAVLAERLTTPICLDESILSAADVRRAARIGACEIVNLKPQRVGGFNPAVEVNRACAESGMDLWIGGMLESGIGQSMAIIASSLSEVCHPGDIGDSTKRYFYEDVVEPPIEPVDGAVAVPREPGLGREVDRDRLAAVTVEHETF
ncbi:MAG: o-succinylbenzoate synthase [Halobacteriota archaeon]